MNTATKTRKIARVATQPASIGRATAHVETVRHFMLRPRFYCVQSFATLSADHLRLGTYTDLGRFRVGMAAAVDGIGANSSPVEVDLPVKDREPTCGPAPPSTQ